MRTSSLLLLASLSLAGCQCGADTPPADTGVVDAPPDDPPRLSPPRVLRSEGDAAVASVAIGPEAASLVAAGWDKAVVLFDVASETGRVVHRIGDGDVFQEGAAAWRGARFVIGTFSATLVFAEDGSLIREIADTGYDVGLSEDGAIVYRLGRDELVAHSVADGSTTARAAVQGAGSMVVGADAVWVARTTDAGEYEVITLDGATLAERSRVPAFGAQIDGDERGLAMFNLSRAEVGADPSDLSPLVTEGITDLDGFALEGGLVVASGFSEGVFLFDARTGARLDAAESANASGIDLRARTAAIGGQEGVLMFAIE